MAIAVDKPIPEFEANATNNVKVSNTSHHGQIVVLFFYPKDNTPGCTTESAAFRDHHAAFRAAGCTVLGLSRDSLASHEKFKARLELPFELLSDPDETVCTAYGVMKLKNMYGKQVRGIERSTFLIDAQGRIAREWRGVKVPGHAEEVLAAARAL